MKVASLLCLFVAACVGDAPEHDGSVDVAADVRDGEVELPGEVGEIAEIGECTSGTQCAPEDLCTEAATCVDNVCVAGAPKACPLASTPCSLAVCDPTTGCGFVAAPADTRCNDSDACTQSDHCGDPASVRAGTCVGDDPVACPPANDCQRVGACVPASGACLYEPEPDDTWCDDALAPDGVTLTAGVCRAGACERLPIVKLGAFHACVLLADGSFKCWGRASSGQLGRGDEVNVGDGVGPSISATRPLVLPAVTAFGVGLGQTCAVTAGMLKCWGSNSGGGLGYMDTNSRGRTPDTTPDKLDPVPLGDFDPVAVAPGLWGSCVLSRTGGVKCWGTQFLGYPGIASIGIPGGVAIATVGLVPLATDTDAFIANALVRTSDYTCALAGGLVRCWGKRDFLGIAWGEDLGDDEAPSDAPTVLPAGVEVVQLSAAQEHTCAVTIEGGLRCWGDNGGGQLGSGDNDDARERTVDVRLGAQRLVKQVAAGARHTCALTATGEVRCWGSNDSGQLGIGTNVGVLVPANGAAVDLGGEAYAISAGWDHTCATLRNGDVKCWGSGQEGRLGNGTIESIGDDANEMPPPALVF